MQNPRSMDYKYLFTDNTTYVFAPQMLQCSVGIQEFLTNPQKYPCTFQVFIEASKITNFWLQHYNLFLECVMHVVSASDTAILLCLGGAYCNAPINIMPPTTPKSGYSGDFTN